VKRDSTIAERLNSAGFLVFIATVVLLMVHGTPALPGLLPSGGLITAAAMTILFDFRGCARPSDDAHILPDHPNVTRFVGGGFLLIVGTSLLVIGVLALSGVIPDSGPVGFTDGA